MLADLRMPGALEALDAILRDVDGGALTAADAIEQLLTAQIQLRNNRRLQAAMRSSRLPAGKQLHDFDFTFQPSLRREQIDRLVHHCHLVTIRGNSYRMRQHTELWQTLHAAHDDAPAARRRLPRQDVATS
ncbi:ATP-binding protein [Luteitalea pratensis]|nr:ATP-binding protein [Luteitalea pratensis]